MCGPPGDPSSGPGREEVGSRHLSQAPTRTCQSGRARQATSFRYQGGILPAEASACPLLGTEQPWMKQQAAPAQGGPTAPIGQCQARSPSASHRLQGHGRPREKGRVPPASAGLTSWRMSSSLGMMDSSRVSLLQEQGQGQDRQRTGSPAARAWGTLPGEGGRRSPVLDQRYDLGVGLSDDTLPVHLHQPVPWGQGQGHV